MIPVDEFIAQIAPGLRGAPLLRAHTLLSVDASLEYTENVELIYEMTNEHSTDDVLIAFENMLLNTVKDQLMAIGVYLTEDTPLVTAMDFIESIIDAVMYDDVDALDAIVNDGESNNIDVVCELVAYFKDVDAIPLANYVESVSDAVIVNLNTYIDNKRTQEEPALKSFNKDLFIKTHNQLKSSTIQDAINNGVGLGYSFKTYMDVLNVSELSGDELEVKTLVTAYVMANGSLESSTEGLMGYVESMTDDGAVIHAYSTRLPVLVRSLL